MMRLAAGLRKYIDAVQWQFVHMFCRPVFKRWVELEVLRGGLPLDGEEVQPYLRNVSWAPPVMQMADPQREVDAMVRAIRAGLMSREMAVASLGYDLAEVDAQIASGNASTDAAGIVLDSDPRRVPQQGNPTVHLRTSQVE
jgi:capsid protein